MEKTKDSKIKALAMYLFTFTEELTKTEIKAALKRLKGLGVTELQFVDRTIKI